MKLGVVLVLGVAFAACSPTGGGTTTILPRDSSSTSASSTSSSSIVSPTTSIAATTSTLLLESEPIDLGPLTPRGGHSVVWTGKEMLVWGGEADELGSELFADGAAFEPESGEWRMLSESPLSPRRYHLATWTDDEVVIVGGVGETDGAAYRPETDTWRLIAPPPITVSAPSGAGIEGLVGSVWTGDELFVWHVNSDQVAAYDSVADRWRSLPATGMGVDNGVLRWDGEHAYAFGGISDYPATNELKVSRLNGDEWEPLPAVDFSTDDYIIGPVPKLTAWAGDRFLAWSDSGYEGRTMTFDPATGIWNESQNVPSPPCEGQGEPISAEGLVFAFGWCGPNLGIFDVKSQTWSESAVGGYPTARYAVWTGEQLINWGDPCCYGTGGDFFTVDAWKYLPGPPDATTLTEAETLVEAFVQFARDPSDGTFGELPLADTVDLGLGSTIIKTRENNELRRPQVWQLDLDLFRAHTGPFSAFDSLSRLNGYETTVGEHPHCASPPVPPPEGYEALDRISVQPRLGPQDSCLLWSTVDFFLLPGGDVAAITLDMWEP